MPHATPPVTVRSPRWLTIREGGISLPPPSTARVLERISVMLAVHEQREVDFDGSTVPHWSARQACCQ